MIFGRVRQWKIASNSGTTISVTLDKTPISGNALVAIHHTGATVSNGVTSSGYGSPVVTLTNASENDETKAHVKIAGGSESTTVTATSASSDENMLIVMEIEGPFTASSQVDIAFGGTRSASAGSYAISAGTPAQAIEVAIAFAMMRTAINVNLNSWSNGFYQFGMGVSSSAKSLALAYKEINSTGSLSTTVTFNTANTCMGGMITLKAHADVVAPPAYGDGYWTEIATPAANRALEDVDPDPSGTADYKGSNGQESVTDAWNGAIIRQPAAGGILEYITEAAGGHGNYYGNEGYTLDLLAGTIAWARHRNPTPDTADLSLDDTDGVDALGNAISRHTYNYQCYDYDDDEFAFFGGNALAGASAAGSSVVLRLQYGTNKTTWVTTGIANSPASVAPWHAWYIGSGEFLFSNQGTSAFYKYSKSATAYSTLATNDLGTVPQGCSLFDSKRGRMVIFGYHASNITILHPYGGHAVQAVSGIPGGLNFAIATIGGIYDSYIDKYVFWQGGTTLYDVDPVTYAMTTRTLSTQTVTPTAPNANGTFNRFAYIRPTTDFPQGAYIIVNATSESTYLFFVAPSSGVSASSYTSGRGSCQSTCMKHGAASSITVGRGASISACSKRASGAGLVNGRGAVVSISLKRASSESVTTGRGTTIAASAKRANSSSLTTGRGSSQAATAKRASGACVTVGRGFVYSASSKRGACIGLTTGRGTAGSTSAKRGVASGLVSGRGASFSTTAKRGTASGRTSGFGWTRSTSLNIPAGSFACYTTGRGSTYSVCSKRGAASGVTTARGATYGTSLKRATASGLVSGRGFSYSTTTPQDGSIWSYTSGRGSTYSVSVKRSPVTSRTSGQGLPYSQVRKVATAALLTTGRGWTYGAAVQHEDEAGETVSFTGTWTPGTVSFEGVGWL